MYIKKAFPSEGMDLEGNAAKWNLFCRLKQHGIRHYHAI